MMKVTFYCGVLTVALGCSSTSTLAVTAHREAFDPLNSSPIPFLADLCGTSKTAPWVTVNASVRGWIAEEDVSALIELLGSERPCRPVIKQTSSYRPSRSTEGDEAALMIDSFRDRFYPNQLHSRTYSEAEKDEIRTWWKRYNAAQRLDNPRG